MDYCHQHNLLDLDKENAEKKFGIKVSLPPGDPLMNLLGNDWECVHWYSTELQRDQDFDEMAKRHEYYRDTDSPSQVLEKIFR